MADLARRHASLQFDSQLGVAKLDTERYPEVAARFNVRGIPNFAVFLGGKLIKQQAGLVNAEQMESWLDAARPQPAV